MHVVLTCLDQLLIPSRDGIGGVRLEVVELKHPAYLVFLQGSVCMFLPHVVSPFVVHHESTKLTYCNGSAVLGMVLLKLPVRKCGVFNTSGDVWNTSVNLG